MSERSETRAATVCAIATAHAPTYRTIELHHVIPVAWQLTTALTGPAPYPGEDPDGRGLLWDSRFVVVCPTHHRNVHFWIVTLMRAVAGGAADAGRAWRTLTAGERRLGEAKIALEALTRFEAESGVALSALIAAHEWGQS